MTKPVALITGVGEGTGAAIARRFAGDGYRVAMLARNQERLANLEDELDEAKAGGRHLYNLAQPKGGSSRGIQLL